MQNKTINRASAQKPDTKLAALISLLEDESSEIASSAISELLTYGKKYELILSEFQESQSPLMRQRIHQLQAIAKIRKNREFFARKLNNKHSGLWKGLNELHLLWYDNDSLEELKSYKKKLINSALEFKPNNIKALAKFMKAMTFVCSPNGSLEPDYYCIGSILDSKIGADFLLCSVANMIATSFGFETKIIITKEDSFAIIDNNKNYLSPTNWTIDNHFINSEYEVWFPGMILKHTLFQLYLCAISADSYRYVYSIGSCLAKALNIKDTKKLFPYPYNFI